MKFSIVTPSLNQGQYISQTIESVINQKGRFDIEYFVIDGGSTDNTVEILKKYEKVLKNSSRIKFYWQSKKDKGQSNAINIAMVKSTGDIFAYINSDDYYLPQAFAKIVTHFTQKPNCQWVVGNCIVTDSKLSWSFWLKQIWPIQMFKSALLIFNTVNQPSVFIRQSLIKKVGPFNEKYHYAFDYDYWLRCQKLVLPCRLFENLSSFRIHNQSKGNQSYTKQFNEDLQVFKQHNSNTIIYIIHYLADRFTKFVYSFLK